MQEQTPVILALGDSLTKGYYQFGSSYHPYATKLSSLLQDQYHVEPFGVNGEKTDMMKKRLDEILDEYSEEAFRGVIIIGGTNDLASYSSEMIIGNLIGMFRRCMELESVKFVVACSIPSSAIDGKSNDQSSMIKGYLKNKKEVNLAVKSFVEEQQGKMIFVDLMEELNFCKCTEEERDLYWDDTLHFTPVGYDKIADILYSKLKQSNLL